MDLAGQIRIIFDVRALSLQNVGSYGNSNISLNSGSEMWCCIHEIHKCKFRGGQWRLIFNFDDRKLSWALESEPPRIDCCVSNIESTCGSSKDT